MKKQLMLVSLILILSLLMLVGCSSEINTDAINGGEAPIVGNLKYESSMELKYAEQFAVDYYEDGYALISIMKDGSRFLIVPENMNVPENIDDNINVIHQPMSNIYLLATGSMAFFNDLQALDSIRLSGTKAEGWFIPEVVEKMEKSNIIFAGKYSEPDYELIRAENSKLSIQSNMISHAPEIKDKLEELGITVLVDFASYEPHPLGRTEWIKLYSVLLDKEEMAEEIFNKQSAILEDLENVESTGKTVAFFYVNSSSGIVARNTNDYIPKMIGMTGGKYVFDNLGDSNKANSTTTMGMEEFYSAAKEADYIIYNSTIVGGVNSIADIVNKHELFANFKAVIEGNVWCTGKNFYQNTNEFGNILGEIRTIMIEDIEKYPDLKHFYKLK